MSELWNTAIDRRTAGVLASLTDAVFVTDPAGRLLRINPAAERLLGRTSSELQDSRPPYKFWPNDDLPRLSEFLEMCDTSDEGPPPWIHTTFTHVSGRRVPVRLTVCNHWKYCLHIATPRVDIPEDAPSDPQHVRISELEAGLRNICWELEALGVRSPGTWFRQGAAPPAALRELSARQREVLDAFIDGHSVAATAAQLHLSEHTVRSHLKVIYRKMGVRSKTELMRRLAHLDPS